jgi:hypothetical protein
MIPDFDNHGNLPPGIYKASIDEIIARFSPGIMARRLNTDSLLKLYNLVKDFAHGIYIDGSYVTSKLAPNDVDVIVVLPKEFDFNSDNGIRFGTLIFNEPRLHVFYYRKGLEENKISKLLIDFQTVAYSNPPIQKGIIYLECKND